jgi:uncharacterized protein YebE (UPF0316 family)
MPFPFIPPHSPLLPALVFTAETCVVTLATVRTIFVARGYKTLAPLLGFFEVATWLFAIGQIMQNLTNPACYLAFASGFTLGNYLGILLESRLAIGTLMIRTITRKDASGLVEALRSANYGVTRVAAQGTTGPVQIIFTVVKRRDLEPVTALIRGFDPKAFYSVDEVQSAAAGVFPAGPVPRALVPSPLRLLRARKKGEVPLAR